MDKNDEKRNFLSLYNQLEYKYQSIILSTFMCLTNYKTNRITGYKPYDIAGVIEDYQKKKGYTDQEVCDKVSEMTQNDKDEPFDIGTYRKIKQRNTQSSQAQTNWLNLIAKALDFEPTEYKKYLTDDGMKHTQELITQQSNISIDTLYDLLSPKEKRALKHLTISLLTHCTVPEYDTEFMDDEY